MCGSTTMRATTPDRWTTWGLLSLWPLATAVSVIGFYARWQTWPELLGLLMANTLLAPFALAKSAADLLGLTSTHSLRGTLLAVFLFWPLCGSLLWGAARGSRLALAALAVVVTAAAWNWLVVATGMIGI